MRLIPKRWAPVATAASTDKTRRFLNAVHVVELPDGAVRIEATDGGRVIRIEGKTVPAAEFPVFDGLDYTDDAPKEGIIPVKAFVDGLKAVPKKPHMPVLGYMAVVLDGTTATLASTDLERKSIAKVDVIPGPYPKIDQIPQGEPAARVRVNAQLLGEVLLALAKMVNGAAPAVTISVFGDMKPLLITGDGEEGEKITALVAPLGDRR